MNGKITIIQINHYFDTSARKQGVVFDKIKSINEQRSIRKYQAFFRESQLVEAARRQRLRRL